MKELRENWRIVRLGEVCQVVTGNTPPKSENKYYGGDIPWIKPDDLDKGKYVSSSKEYLSDMGATEARVLPIGSVLVSCIGNFGKSAIAGRPLATNQQINSLIPSDEVDSSFLYYACKTLLPQMEAFATTTVVPIINKSSFASLQIPLPPLDEQRRIVYILDEAEALRRLRARADERMADFIPALFNQMFGDPADRPVKLLADVAEVVSGVAKGRRFNGQPTVVVPYLRVANVQAGYLDLAEIKTIEALPSEVEALSLKQGDVLLTEGGDFDKLGRGALLDHDLSGCIHQNHIFRVRVDQKTLMPIYFAQYLQTQHAKAYFLRCAKKTTNLASINMTQLRGLPVPLPSLSLQREFAARVAEARALQDQQVRSRARLDAGFQALLHRAFNGEL